jgi:signal transduction histidine kinase
MQSATSIDTRLVLRVYAWVALIISLDFWWVWFAPTLDLPGIPDGRAGLIRIFTSALAGLGFTAVGMSRIESPASRQTALWWFALGHLYFGLLFLAQATALFPAFIPYPLGWLPLIAGIVLMFIAVTSAHAPKLAGRFRFLHDEEEPHPHVHVVMLRERGPKTSPLQSQYEEHIRQAARGEERARLARDLHDAVKQQLFAIQTSAATVQERLSGDPAGARSALDQVRTCARDAMTEMKALIEQLQASPVENTGLVAALQQQCEALALRSGADVKCNVGVLPPSAALPPGTQEALFRAAQEALSNVARHARATEVTVRLAMKDDRLELTIRDNGAGFDGLKISPGMGLKNMSARVHEVGGRMQISPSPNGGTLIGFSVPCDLDTARDYAKKALIAVAVVAVATFNSIYGDRWEQPWSEIVAWIALITVARYAAAWWRTRGRAEQALA